MINDSAAPTLREASPYAPDRGHSIGRDPRRLAPDDFAAAGVPIMLARDAIRAKCLDCCGDNAAEVRKCAASACPLWAFRMTGSLPPRLKRAVLGEPRQGPARMIDATS